MYYIAVVAPPAINDQVLQWKLFMRDRFGCIVALKSPAHITLVSPFWMNKDLQPQLEAALQTFSSDKQTFSIQLRNFDSFKPRVIFIHVEQSSTFARLKDDLENYLLANRSFPIKRETRTFHPHMTIANRDLHKKDFNEAWEYFKNKQYTESFLISGLSLMKHNGTYWEVAYTSNFPLV
jgi:2'-5' RNA ligase